MSNDPLPEYMIINGSKKKSRLNQISPSIAAFEVQEQAPPTKSRGPRPREIPPGFNFLDVSNEYGIVVSAYESTINTIFGPGLTQGQLHQFNHPISSLRISHDGLSIAIGFKSNTELHIYDIRDFLSSALPNKPLEVYDIPHKFQQIKWSPTTNTQILLREIETCKISIIFRDSETPDGCIQTIEETDYACASFDQFGNLIVASKDELFEIDPKDLSNIKRSFAFVEVLGSLEFISIYAVEEYLPNQWILIALCPDEEDPSSEINQTYIFPMTGSFAKEDFQISAEYKGNQTKPIAKIIEGAQRDIDVNAATLEFKVIVDHGNKLAIACSALQCITLVTRDENGAIFLKSEVESVYYLKIDEFVGHLRGITYCSFEDVLPQDSNQPNIGNPSVSFIFNGDRIYSQEIPKYFLTFDKKLLLQKHFVCYHLVLDKEFENGSAGLLDQNQKPIPSKPLLPQKQQLPVLQAEDIPSANLPQAAESPRVDVQSVDVQSVDVQSVDVQSVDVQSVDVQSVDVQSVDVKSVDVQSVDLAAQPEKDNELAQSQISNFSLGLSELSSANPSIIKDQINVQEENLPSIPSAEQQPSSEKQKDQANNQNNESEVPNLLRDTIPADEIKNTNVASELPDSSSQSDSNHLLQELSSIKQYINQKEIQSESEDEEDEDDGNQKGKQNAEGKSSQISCGYVFNHFEKKEIYTEQLPFSHQIDINLNLHEQFVQPSQNSTEFFFLQNCFVFAGRSTSTKSSIVYAIPLHAYQSQLSKEIAKWNDLYSQEDRKQFEKPALRMQSLQGIVDQSHQAIGRILDSFSIFESNEFQILSIHNVNSSDLAIVFTSGYILIPANLLSNGHKAKNIANYPLKPFKSNTAVAAVFNRSKSLLGVISSQDNQVDVYETYSGNHLFSQKQAENIAFSYDCNTSLKAYVVVSKGILEIDFNNECSQRLIEIKGQILTNSSLDIKHIHFEEFLDGKFVAVIQENNEDCRVYVALDVLDKNPKKITFSKVNIDTSNWDKFLNCSDAKIRLGCAVLFVDQLDLLTIMFNQEGSFCQLQLTNNRSNANEVTFTKTSYKDNSCRDITGFIPFDFASDHNETHSLSLEEHLYPIISSIFVFNGIFNMRRFVILDKKLRFQLNGKEESKDDSDDNILQTANNASPIISLETYRELISKRGVLPPNKTKIITKYSYLERRVNELNWILKHNPNPFLQEGERILPSEFANINQEQKSQPGIQIAESNGQQQIAKSNVQQQIDCDLEVPEIPYEKSHHLLAMEALLDKVTNSIVEYKKPLNSDLYQSNPVPQMSLINERAQSLIKSQKEEIAGYKDSNTEFQEGNHRINPKEITPMPVGEIAATAFISSATRAPNSICISAYVNNIRVTVQRTNNPQPSGIQIEMEEWKGQGKPISYIGECGNHLIVVAGESVGVFRLQRQDPTQSIEQRIPTIFSAQLPKDLGFQTPAVNHENLNPTVQTKEDEKKDIVRVAQSAFEYSRVGLNSVSNISTLSMMTGAGVNAAAANQLFKPNVNAIKIGEVINQQELDLLSKQSNQTKPSNTPSLFGGITTNPPNIFSQQPTGLFGASAPNNNNNSLFISPLTMNSNNNTNNNITVNGNGNKLFEQPKVAFGGASLSGFNAFNSNNNNSNPSPLFVVPKPENQNQFAHPTQPLFQLNSQSNSIFAQSSQQPIAAATNHLQSSQMILEDSLNASNLGSSSITNQQKGMKAILVGQIELRSGSEVTNVSLFASTMIEILVTSTSKTNASKSASLYYVNRSEDKQSKAIEAVKTQENCAYSTFAPSGSMLFVSSNYETIFEFFAVQSGNKKIIKQRSEQSLSDLRRRQEKVSSVQIIPISRDSFAIISLISINSNTILIHIGSCLLGRNGEIKPIPILSYSREVRLAGEIKHIEQVRFFSEICFTSNVMCIASNVNNIVLVFGITSNGRSLQGQETEIIIPNVEAINGIRLIEDSRQESKIEIIDAASNQIRRFSLTINLNSRVAQITF